MREEELIFFHHVDTYAAVRKTTIQIRCRKLLELVPYVKALRFSRRDIARCYYHFYTFSLPDLRRGGYFQAVQIGAASYETKCCKLLARIFSLVYDQALKEMLTQDKLEYLVLESLKYVTRDLKRQGYVYVAVEVGKLEDWVKLALAKIRLLRLTHLLGDVYLVQDV